MRQTVHEVEIQRGDSRATQQTDRLRDGLIWLHPSGRFLNVRIEILNSKARAIHSGPRQRFHQRLVQQARIEFDGVFGVGANIKMPAYALADFGKTRGSRTCPACRRPNVC